MASLVLLLSELIKHQGADLAFLTPLPPATCAAAVVNAPPQSAANWVSRSRSGNSTEGFGKAGEKDAEEDLAELRVSADLVWP
ncbi:hypothetical protein NMG60_11012730 [Bertholletia excelsa]